MKIDWINSWKAGNKKERYEFSFRLGTLTILEISFSKGFRFMILNLGFQM
tara:strand:+ start:325 stop:474 length:150 start_codon:yes stop_codon:yes gene_type:complete